MDFISNANWFSILLGGACFVGIPLISFIGWLISGNMDNKRMEKRSAEKEALRQRGIMAPAIVLSARSTMERSVFGRKERRIDYEVDVLPDGRAPFKQSFQHWTERRGYTAVMGQLVGEAGKKIWVTYDPNDPSQMIFEHDDQEHEQIASEQELNERRAKFNKLTEGNEALKINGKQAEAIITGVDDLNLPYPLKKGRAMHLYFDVMPRDGSVFRAEGDVLIGDVALEKYSVGKTVYVRFDPNQPERAVLDSERNKSIQ
jgi:hypothetical protein